MGSGPILLGGDTEEGGELHGLRGSLWGMSSSNHIWGHPNPGVWYQESLLLFSCTVVFDSLWLHGLQHARLPYLSPSPGVCSNVCPLNWWCHPTISSSVAPSPPALNLSQHRVFSNELALHIRWPKYGNFSFSISPSNEYSGLISFRSDWESL